MSYNLLEVRHQRLNVYYCLISITLKYFRYPEIISMLFQFQIDLKPEDVQILATQISRYPEVAVIAFKRELEDCQHPLSLPQDKAKWWYYLMKVITKWMTENSHTKKIMANKLIKLHATFKDTHDVKFRELAKRIDFQSKTKANVIYD